MLTKLKERLRRRIARLGTFISDFIYSLKEHANQLEQEIKRRRRRLHQHINLNTIELSISNVH